MQDLKQYLSDAQGLDLTGGNLSDVRSISDDGNVISNEYVRMDEDGKITGVSHAVYRRMR